MAKIKCPLMNKEIEKEICFDICMVAEGLAPARTAPEAAIKMPEFDKICLECEMHKE